MLKDIILWKYERASWQWDLLCFLIILFIFLTPKTWFDRKERLTMLKTEVVVKSSGSNDSEMNINLENQTNYKLQAK
jgi:hypothetical protein